MGFFETEWERPEFDSVPSLAENVVWRIPGCDDVVVRKTLQEVYRDFCKRSAALRTWRKIELEAHETHYPVAPILSGEIDCVTQVMRDGRHPLRHGRDWKVIGDPPFVELPFAKSIIEPDTAVEDAPPEFVIVEAVEIPHISEERAPKAFLRRYGDVIVDGALARLFSMSNRSWSDPEQARQHGVAYSNALGEARLRSTNGGPAANVSPNFAIDMRSMV